MKTQHTPGPWTFVRCPTPESFHVYSPGIYTGPVGSICFTKTYSDAALIAAAPELLEALKETLFLLEGYAVQYGHAPTLDKKISAAKEVIKKATV